MTEPKKTPAIRPFADGVPTDLAWRQGRRIYVRAGYHSTLNQDLLQAGAKWDPDVKARWVGTTKAPLIAPLISAHQERVQAITDVKALGLWVATHYEDTRSQALARELGAVWDKTRRAWAARTEQDQARLEGSAKEFARARKEAAKRAQAEEEQARAQAEAEQRKLEQVLKERRARAQAEAADRVVADSGRTPTGETAQLRLVSTRRMNKSTAQQMAHPVGTLVRLDDGRRGIITTVKVWFTDDEMASSVCWHNHIHDQAHWDLEHTVAVVEPTTQEIANDTARTEEATDAAELHTLMESLHRSGTPREDYTVLDQDQVLGTITHRYGSVLTMHDGGTAHLFNDGTIMYRHPGYYDDYRSTERTITDQALVERMRTALAKGPRTRTYTNQMDYDYTVTPAQEQQE